MTCLILGKLDYKLNEPDLTKTTSTIKKIGGSINLIS